MGDTLMTSDFDTGMTTDSFLPYQTGTAWTGSNMPSSPGLITAGNLSLLTSVMGAANSAIGSYFAAKSQQYQAKSAAVNMQYQSDMAAINARQSEYQAESDVKAGQSQIANYTMQAGQQKASTTVSSAARGLRAGVGTTAEVAASADIVKDINVFNINSNAVRQAAAARVQGTNYTNQSNLDRVSAANDTRTADSVSPFSSVAGSLLTSASTIANQWNQSQRMKMYLANGGYFPQGGFN